MPNRNLYLRQSKFAAAILDPDRGLPSGLVGPDGEADARRFAVYRNNVVVGLCEVLKAAFPVVRRIVGDEFFMAMARIYVVREPPISPIMLDYGGGFPDFVGSFEPASELPYLGDVAVLERAWMEAYHAADMYSLEPEALGGIKPDEIETVVFELHPSIRVVRSSFPVLSIWHTNSREGAAIPIDLANGGEDVLISRPGAEVDIRSLPAGVAAFLLELKDGRSIVEAAKVALASEARFDLAGSLTGLISMGAFVGYRLPTKTAGCEPA